MSTSSSDVIVKGGMVNALTLYAEAKPLEVIDIKLQDMAQHMPKLIQDMPLIIDFGNSAPDLRHIQAVTRSVQNAGANPFAIRGSGDLTESVYTLGLSLLPPSRKKAETEIAAQTTSPMQAESVATTTSSESPDTSHNAPPAQIIHSTIRNGQRIIEPHGDLIIMGNVNPGAEIMAAGNIHVYGTLKGKAMAGFTGNERALIICQSLEAILISINGIYQTKDCYDPALIGKSVIITYKNDRLLINHF